MEDSQVLENAPEVGAARSTVAHVNTPRGSSEPVFAEARTSFAAGTPEIVAVGEDPIANEARRMVAATP